MVSDVALLELLREQCMEDVLDIVVNLNKNKILGRLVSRHFR
jgi:hypothetical protein